MNPFNDEAGATPAPSGALEQALARAAAALAWRAVPYFALRYAERGHRFALSDSGWLVTLAELDAEARTDQIEWLTRVLAPRGMPSLLVEVQLRATARIGRRMGWSGAPLFATAAAQLTARREALVPAAVFVEADRCFADTARGLPHVRGTGALIAAAHADVAARRVDSTTPLLGWLGDRGRFDARWCAAVARTDDLVHTRIGRR